MKKIIALLLAVITVAALFCGCAKKEPDHKVEALLDYYTGRLSKNITEDDIKYIGEVKNESSIIRSEYLIENEEEGVNESILVEETGNMYRLYKKDNAEKGMYIHIYLVRSETTEK